jgi:branched-chain amino acid transport system substrate-binding protein
MLWSPGVAGQSSCQNRQANGDLSVSTIVAFIQAPSSGRRARLLQACRAAHHCRFPRLDPLDAKSRDGWRYPQDRQTRLLWRHRSRADENGQSLVDPIPSQRFLLGPRVETLGKKSWAIVHSTDAFGTAGFKSLSEALGKLGAKVAIDQGYPNQSQDFTPVVLAIKSSGADVIGSYFTFDNDLAIFARQLRQLGVTTPWVGSPTITTAGAVKLAGPALYGTYGVADYAVDASPESKEFAQLYSAVSAAPPDSYSSWTYDAIGVLSTAINKAVSTDPDKIRAAILSTRGYMGAEGEYNFDEFGDGLHGYNIVRNDKGVIVYDKHIEFKD